MGNILVWQFWLEVLSLQSEEDREMDPAEQTRINEIAEMVEAKTRMIFDQDNMEIDCSRQRCTDAKHNSRIILPGPSSQKWRGSWR